MDLNRPLPNASISHEFILTKKSKELAIINRIRKAEILPHQKNLNDAAGAAQALPVWTEGPKAQIVENCESQVYNLAAKYYVFKTTGYGNVSCGHKADEN